MTKNITIIILIFVILVLFINTNQNNLSSQELKIDTVIFSDSTQDIYDEYQEILNKNNPNTSDLKRLNSIFLTIMYDNIKNQQKVYNNLKILTKSCK
jgi:hypothetical protein